MNENVRQRVSIVIEKPNPLFEKWLTEWKEDAKKRGSKMERTFSFALTNLRKFKIPLASGQECKILKGFGEKLCKMLDEKLEEHNRIKENQSQDLGIGRKTPNNKRRQSHSKEYIPQYRSGGYAILLALQSSLPDLLTKEEIIHLGKHNSNTSFLKPDPGSYYTAWSSMRTLLEKGLVIKQGKPAKYFLTEKGQDVAQKLMNGDYSPKSTDSAPKLFEKSPTKSLSEVLLKGTSPPKINNAAKEKKSSTLTYLSHIQQTAIIPTKDDQVIDISDDSNGDLNDAIKYSSKEIPDCKIDLPSIESLKRLIPETSNEESTSNSDYVNTGSNLSFSSESSSYGQAKNPKSIQKFMSADAVNKNKNSTKRGLKKCSSSSSIQSTLGVVQEDCFIFEPNSFDIILYVDNQETVGSNTDIQDDPLLSKLQNNCVMYEVKHLKVGDYVWICRHRQSKKELVLPYIIERKRLDDFASSIKDGRYQEQKFRLKKSGIQNMTYLIEHFGKHVSLPVSTLHQAAANTAIQDGFNVKFTANIKHTAKYLASFSTLLIRNYKNKTVVSCPKENLSLVNIVDDLISLMPFNEFNKASSKNKPLKVSELFIKMLLQIKGLSVEKCCAIVDVYPTPRLLKEAYSATTPAQGEKLLSKITFGKYNKTIGSILSKVVYDLFTMEKF